MVFSSPVFLLVFLPVVLLLYYLPLARGRRWRNGVLLVASLLFYAYGEPVFVFAMLVSILVNWLLAQGIARDKAHARPLLVLAIAWDVGLLVSFKYVAAIIHALVPDLWWVPVLDRIGLPIGISFFTFQLMSYVVDVYRGDVEEPGSLARVALYVSLFPQLVAGPIVRYKDIADQLGQRAETFSDFARGMRRFVLGLGEKVLLANFLASIADMTFAESFTPVAATAWVGAIAYALQILFDFSGYSDMAIGLGLMFGLRLNENFNYPYLASSCADFWRRWHISLSTWFRDYVYIPLGGSRKGMGRTLANLFVVWLLTGIWHGANLTFVAWGLLWFVAIATERLLGREKADTPVSHVLTLAVVLVGWVLFRSPSIASALRYLGYLVGVGCEAVADAHTLAILRETCVVLLAGLVFATPLPSKLSDFLDEHRASWAELALQVLVLLLCVAELVSSSYQPFIYFNF